MLSNTPINTLDGTWKEEGKFRSITELHIAEPNSRYEEQTMCVSSVTTATSSEVVKLTSLDLDLTIIVLARY